MKKILTLSAWLLGTLTAVKAQSDNPCGAPNLPVNASCVTTIGNLPSSSTNTAGVPAPGCASYSGPDVWYSVTVPASGTLIVEMFAAAGPADMGMAIYSGACGSLSLVECDDDDGTGLMPYINHGGLTPGSTVYVRIWEYGGGSFGSFSICATAGAAATPCTPPGANGNCAGATAFCTSPVPTVYCNSTGVPSLGGGGIYGCLGSTPNPAFYYLNIDAPGAIDILIQQNSTAGTPIDVDFVLWGPFATQAAMCPGMSAANIVDCSYSAAAVETVNIPASASAGQWYLLLVTNFSGAAGSISYTQTGGSGSTDCSITAPCTVTGVPTHVPCFGGTGSITANVTGSGPYTVSVVNSGGTTVATQSGAGTSFNFAGLPAGTYTINSSATGTTPACTTSTTTTINGPAAALAASSSHTDVLCGGGCTGTLSASASGGTPVYSYSWSGGLGAGANKVNVCAGTYTVTVTDANGCTSTSTQTVLDNPAIILNPTSTPTTCAGTSTGSVSVTASGGTGTINFNWSGGLGAGASHTNVPAGTYTVTATDANGCQQTANVTVADGIPLSVAMSSTNETCLASNGTATANATGPGTITYQWFSDPGMTTMIGTTPTITGLAGGTYYVTVTSDAGCSVNTSVVVNSPAVATITSLTINNHVTGFGLCNGDATVTYTGTAPISVLWTNGGTNDNNSSLCAGVHCVTITDANGCTDDACITITEPPLLEVDVTGVDPLCDNSCDGTANANATGGVPPYTYVWSSGGNSSSLTGLCAGTYTVIVTDANGNTATDNITLVDPPTLVLNPPVTVNVNCNNACDGSITASATGGTGTLAYDIPALGAGPNYTGVCAGTYVLTVTDDNNCQASQTITITEPPLLNIVMSSVNASCTVPNGSATATVNGGVTPYTYLWSNGATTAVNSGIVSGTYDVTVTDANGCIITGSVVVGNNPPLVIQVSPNPTICNGETATVTATASGGSGGPYSFTWEDENGNIAPNTTVGAVSTAALSPVDTLTYTITVDDGCPTSVTDTTVTVYVNPLPQVTIVTQLPAGCTPFTADLHVVTDIGISFVYDFTCDGTPDLNSEMPDASFTYTSPGSYDVCVTTTSQYGCSSSVSMSNMVTAYPLPVAGFVATPLAVSILTPTINFTSISTGASFFTWDFDDSTSSSGPAGSEANGLYTSGPIQQPEHVYQDTGHYEVTLTVENVFGCIDQVTHPVVIEPDYEFFTPNSFTPNGDGINDVFMPKGIGIDVERYEFYVFDRWGQVIFKGTTQDSFWDGTENGLKCKSDTYVWKVVLVDFKKIKHSYTGIVNLLR